MRHVAIVTGANHGIGAATARRLAADGVAALVTSYRSRVAEDSGTPEQYQRNRMRPGAEVADAINDAGGTAISVDADLADPVTIDGLFDRAEERLGTVDILVHNATGWHSGDTFNPVPTRGSERPEVPGDPELSTGDTNTDQHGRLVPSVTADLFDRTFAVDARAGALLIARFAERLAAATHPWGRIVALTSGGPAGFPDEVTYGAAKAALENYVRSAATELGVLGITANLVHPPVTDTGWVTDAVRDFVADDPDHLHIAAPEEVAEVISWLCSDAARMVTGNVIRMR